MILRRLHPSSFGFFGGMLVGFLMALFAFGNLAHFLADVTPAWAQSATMRIMDGTHTQLARVNHTGQLAVDATVTVTTDNVNVFHQSTVRHISSVTHVVILDWQRWAHLQVSQSGTWIVAAAHIQNMPSVAQGGTWTVQAAHQGGEWNVRHVTSVTHVALMSVAGTNLALGAGLPIGHITSVIHISAAGTPWNFNMALAVRCVNTGATAFEACGGAGAAADAVNVFHQSTIRHVSSVQHVRLILNDNLNSVMAVHITSRYDPNTKAIVSHAGALFVTCLTAAGVAESCAGTSTPDAVNVFHQSTIAHVSSVTHVMVASHQVLRVMGAHVTGSIHVAGLTNVGSGAPGTGTTQMVCHSTLAIHVAAAAPGYTQLIHLTSTNNGVDQTAWRIYICGIVLVSAHAQAFSLLEGVGTTCATGKRPLIGAWRPDDAFVMAASGGISSVAPFPWISTQNPGNNLCIVQTSRTTGSVSGVITYRAGP